MHVIVFAVSFVMFVVVAFYTPLLRKLKYHHRATKNWFSGRSRRNGRDGDDDADAPVTSRESIESALEGVVTGEETAGMAAARKARQLRASSRRANREMESEANDSHSDGSGSNSDGEEGDDQPVGVARTKKGQGRAAVMSVISGMFGLLFWLAMITTSRCYDKNTSMSWTLWLGAGVVGILGLCSTMCGYQIILMDRTEKRKKLIPPAICLTLVVLTLVGTAIAFGASNGFFEFECLPGFYSATGVYTGWNGCDRCPAGSYCPGKQEPSTKCLPGQFCIDGVAAPAKCPAGKYFGKSGGALAKCCSTYTHDMCELNPDKCQWGLNPEGRFGNESACLWRSWGDTTLNWKSSAETCCIDCPAGKYALEGSDSCSFCPSKGKAAKSVAESTDLVCSGISRSLLTQYTCDPQDYSLGLRGGFEDFTARGIACDAPTMQGYCDPTAAVTGSPCVCVYKGVKTTQFGGPACQHTATLAALGCSGSRGTACSPRSAGTAFDLARFTYSISVPNNEPKFTLEPTLRTDQNIRYHHIATGHSGAAALNAIVATDPGLRAIKLSRPNDWANCSALKFQNTGQLDPGNADLPLAGATFGQTFDLRLQCNEPRLAGLCTCAGSSMVVMEINNTLSVAGQDPFPLSKSIFVTTKRERAIDTRLSQFFKPQDNDIQDSFVAIGPSGKRYTSSAFSSTRDFSTAGTSGGFTYHLEWRSFHRSGGFDTLQLTPLSATGQPLSVSVTLNRTLSTVKPDFFPHADDTLVVGIDSEVQADAAALVTVPLFPDCSPGQNGVCTPDSAGVSPGYEFGSYNIAFFEIRVKAENPDFSRWYRLNITAV